MAHKVSLLRIGLVFGLAVAKANATPVTADDFYTPNATIFTVSSSTGVLANDSSDVGGLYAASYSPPPGGALSLFTDGSFTFTPNYGLATNTSWTYTATDSSGAKSSATVTFDMESTLPQAVDDSYTPNATTFSIAEPQGLLTNDTGGIGNVMAMSYTPTADGTVNLFTDGSFTFTPNYGLATNTSFTYVISDQLGRTSSATVTFDMESTLPQAVDDSYTMLAGDILSLGPLGLLGNDFGGIGSLEVISFSPITDGLLSVFTDGAFMFTPGLGFYGTTHFDYWIGDALGRQSLATAWIEVLPGTVPEPATLALFGLGLAGLGFSRRRTS